MALPPHAVQTTIPLLLVLRWQVKKVTRLLAVAHQVHHHRAAVRPRHPQAVVHHPVAGQTITLAQEEAVQVAHYC